MPSYWKWHQSVKESTEDCHADGRELCHCKGIISNVLSSLCRKSSDYVTLNYRGECQKPAPEVVSGMPQLGWENISLFLSPGETPLSAPLSLWRGPDTGSRNGQ